MSEVAVVFGASGLVGAQVESALLAREDVSRVISVARRASTHAHPKRAEIIVPDFGKLDEAPPIEGASVAFVCLGTTIKTAGSESRFREVDHDYAVAAARLAARSGVRRLALVSAIGADVKAATFYSRVKGETERDVASVASWDALLILRPSLLLGERTERRSAERMGILIGRPLAGLMRGPLSPYRPVEARTVARSMVNALLATSGPLARGHHVLTYDDMARLAAAG